MEFKHCFSCPLYFYKFGLDENEELWNFVKFLYQIIFALSITAHYY